MNFSESAPEMPPVAKASRTSLKPFGFDDLVQHWIALLTHYYLTTPRLLGGNRYRRKRRSSPEDQPSERLEEIVLVTGISAPRKAATPAAAERAMSLKLRAHIRRGTEKLKAVGWREALPVDLRRSLASVESLLGLGEPEVKCLAFVVLLHTDDRMATAALMLGCSLDRQTTIEIVAASVGLPVHEAREALSNGSRLMASQLFRFAPGDDSLDDKFKWCVRGFAQEMMLPGFEPLRALRSRIVKAPKATLSWSAFSHLGKLRDVILAYLRQAVANNQTGVNLLLHGEPGVGKSEFARLLAQEIGCDLFEVSTEDDDGDPVEPLGRLQALRVLHGFSSGQRCLLVFDEVEDVFPKREQPGVFQRPRPKGWLNRVLENNTAPTIWLSNSVDGIDPAFVRRFDLVLHLKNLPAANREAQMRNLPISLPPTVISRLAACDQLTPAVVHRAARVAGAVSGQLPEANPPEVMEALVNQTLYAQGLGQLGVKPPTADIYDPSFVQCDLDLKALVEGIVRAGSARICLYGPPGTGKTAFGRWAAKCLQRPLHLKRASDLLSPLVGQAEKNIAAAFNAAAAEGAVLLIDEVDSYLQDRGRAQRSWEVTQVNEFLTQMEQFDGIFIATTNLMEGLDAAAMRRFELKAKFDYLRPAQAKSLLSAHLVSQGLPPATPNELAALESLLTLTPGDFAALARQHRFHPLANARAWIAGLVAECSHKPGTNRRIAGFNALPKAS